MHTVCCMNTLMIFRLIEIVLLISRVVFLGVVLECVGYLLHHSMWNPNT